MTNTQDNSETLSRLGQFPLFCSEVSDVFQPTHAPPLVKVFAVDRLYVTSPHGTGGAFNDEFPVVLKIPDCTLKICRDQQGSMWQPGAEGMGLPPILLDPTNPNRIKTANSSAQML